VIAPGVLPPRDSVLRHHQPHPGFAVFHAGLVGVDRHLLTVDEHQSLADANRVSFAELDDLARPLLRDSQVKRGNLATLGPRSAPLAYVVGPGVVAVADGRHNPTFGGWVRPGGEEVPRDTGYDREADDQAEREAEQRARTAADAIEWDEKVLHPTVYLGRSR